MRARILLLSLDSVAAIGFVAVFSFETGEPWRALYLIPVAAAALRFGLVGGVIGGSVMVGATIVVDALGPGLQWRTAFARVLVGMLAGIVIGYLRDTLTVEQSRAEARAAEAERLRDELGHRVDVLETANRCARALGSSLELDEAFGAFIRELRGLVPFERTAIVLVEGDTATTMATAGRGAGEVFPPGNSDPIEGSLLERVLEGKLVVRRDLAERDSPADEKLLALGLRSELVDAAPGRRAHDRDAEPVARHARTPSARTRSSSSRCWVAWLRPPSRTSAPTRPSGDASKSSRACRSFAPTSCPSSRTSCAARWRQ